LIGVVALAAAGCGGVASSSSTTARGSCSAALDWSGARYYGVAAKASYSAPGPDLRPAAVQPACTDTNHSDARPQRVAIRAVDGTDPALAIADADRGLRGTVFVTPGTFPQLPGHPLHRVLYGAAGQPRRAGDHRRCRVRGAVAEVGLDGFGVRQASGREMPVTVDAGTSIAGAGSVGGQPALRRGDRVDVRARRCMRGGVRVTAVRIKVM
jgi:hypothetical protein